MKKEYLVNSRRSCELMKLKVEEAFTEGKYVRFTYETGEPVNLEQLALFHIWLKKWVGHIRQKSDDDVRKDEVEDLKRTVKARYYEATGAHWMIERVPDRHAPNGERVKYTSAANWSKGEMFQVMEWMQNKAAERNLILESIGEHQKLKDQQNGAIPETTEEEQNGQG